MRAFLACLLLTGCATVGYPPPDCRARCEALMPGSRPVVARCDEATCRCVCERPGAQPFAGTLEVRR